MNRAARLRALAVAALIGAVSRGCAAPPPAATARPIAATPPVAVSPPSALNARTPDAFDDPPADLPKRPGVLVRSEPLTGVTLPASMRAFRLLYTTTIDAATPATAVATLFVPANAPPGPRPLIAWAHGTTGLVKKCVPSLMSTPAEGIPAPDAVVRAGWVIVATDYSFAEKGGPHPYLIGEGESRAVLDAVRAARQMAGLALASRTVVWGYSQGGHAALWAGSVGPRYAPDVEIAGVAAIAPAANVKQLLEQNVAVDKRLGPYIARAYSRFYADIGFEEALRPEALAPARAIAELCVSLPPEDPARISALLGSFDGPALATAQNPALAARLAENTARGPIAAPLVIAQGLDDLLVLPPTTAAYVEERCGAGQPLEYWTFANVDHGAIVRERSPLEAPLVAWTAARFAGDAPAPGCTRRAF